MPRPVVGEESFAESILKLCESSAYDALLPTRLTSLEVLIPYRERLLRHVAVLMPTQGQFTLGIDKKETIDMCRKLDVVCPETLFLTKDSSLPDIANSYGFPIVVKHRRNFGASFGVRMASDLSGFIESVDQLSEITGTREDLMVQRFLPGPIFDACLVAKDGRIGGMVTQERRLMKPIAGANFPALAVDLAMGRRPAPFPKLPPGLRFIYLMGRAPVALYQLWKARGFKALRDPRVYKRTWCDFDLDDPLPDLFRLYQEIRSLKTARPRTTDLPAEFDPSFSELTV